MKAGTPWPWDDGNELPRVIQAIKGQGFLYIFVPSPIFVSCTEITQSPISVCQYADNLSWVHGVLRVLYTNVSKFPRHVSAVVKVIECIFERPLITVELRGRHFEIVRSPPRFPLSPKNQTDSCCQNAMVGRVIAISRTPL